MPDWLNRALRIALRVMRVLLIVFAAFAPGQLPPPPKPRREPEVQMVGEPEDDGQR